MVRPRDVLDQQVDRHAPEESIVGSCRSCRAFGHRGPARLQAQSVYPAAASKTAQKPQVRSGSLFCFRQPANRTVIARRIRYEGASAPGALLAYASATQQSTLEHVRSIDVESPSEFVALDAATRRNLEIMQTLAGEREPTLHSLLDTCTTAAGSRLLSSLSGWTDRAAARLSPHRG